MKSRTTTTEHNSLAATVAPEDLQCGEFVAVLNDIVEMPSFLMRDFDVSPEETVRVRYCSDQAGTPLKIKAICLPFVFVKSAYGHQQTIDIRQSQLVRLDQRYARKVWKKLRRKSK
ncbi:MAG: hypothetical protein KDA86_11105 [Planctomycetaceae bacterium]|nr:hypothetical protein [Planctomycetaceae bacterium]